MGVKAFDVMSFNKTKLMDPEQVGYKDSIEIINEELHKTRKSFIKIGWYLKHIHDNKMYEQDGYLNIYEFAMDKFHLSQPTATRFMNVCEEFSVNHNSPELDKKYEDFNISQLFEMLSMTKRQIEQVTPDMTVRQIREMKEPSEETIIAFYNCKIRNTELDSSRQDLKQYLVDNYGKKYNSYHGDDLKYDCSPRGIRIVLGASSEDLEQTEEITWTNLVKQINKLFPLNQSKEEDDNIPGQTSIAEDFPEYLPEDEEKYATSHISEIESVNDDLRIIDGEFREIIEPEKIISIEPEDPEQPEFPVLKNNDQRKEWLAKYKEWGLWYRDENIDVNYYKYDFKDGSRLIVAEYPNRQSYWSDDVRNECFYHLLEKNKKGYKNSYDEKYRHQTDSETYLVEFLKNLQKSKT